MQLQLYVSARIFQQQPIFALNWITHPKQA